jgi:hypothetical protein
MGLAMFFLLTFGNAVNIYFVDKAINDRNT